MDEASDVVTPDLGRCLRLTGRYDYDEARLRLVPRPVPDAQVPDRSVRTTAERLGGSYERAGLVTRDMENA